jgi:hypothetical protein
MLVSTLENGIFPRDEIADARLCGTFGVAHDSCTAHNLQLQRNSESTISEQEWINMTEPLNMMAGILGGVVLRRTSRRSGSTTTPNPTSTLESVPNASVILRSVNLMTSQVNQGLVVRAGQGDQAVPIRFGNPVLPGTQCSAQTDAAGAFCVLFNGMDSSQLVATAQDNASITFLVGINADRRFLRPQVHEVRDLRLVPGGQAVQSALSQALHPVEFVTGLLQDQAIEHGQSRRPTPVGLAPEGRVIAESLRSYHGFVTTLVQRSCQIAQLISGITVPDNRLLLVKLVGIVL